jgi:hypothetical protein
MDDAERRRRVIAEAVQTLKEAELLHPRDPEAQAMRCRAAERLAHDAQAVIESKHHVVVAAEVTTEANDYAQLEPFYEAVEGRRQKPSTPRKRPLVRRRKEIAELPFARLKHLLGFRRRTVRGIEKVRTQRALLCATLNLKAPYGVWAVGPLPADALRRGLV